MANDHASQPLYVLVWSKPVQQLRTYPIRFSPQANHSIGAEGAYT